MILWSMRGYTDPDGEFEGGEMACAIEQAEDGYRLLVFHDGEIQTEESHGSIDTARGTAEMLKADLLARGWLEEAS
jgi:sulfur transfer complex TusBCD TusB component (DsrH family)